MVNVYQRLKEEYRRGRTTDVTPQERNELKKRYGYNGEVQLVINKLRRRARELHDRFGGREAYLARLRRREAESRRQDERTRLRHEREAREREARRRRIEEAKSKGSKKTYKLATEIVSGRTRVGQLPQKYVNEIKKFRNVSAVNRDAFVPSSWLDILYRKFPKDFTAPKQRTGSEVRRTSPTSRNLSYYGRIFASGTEEQKKAATIGLNNILNNLQRQKAGYNRLPKFIQDELNEKRKEKGLKPRKSGDKLSPADWLLIWGQGATIGGEKEKKYDIGEVVGIGNVSEYIQKSAKRNNFIPFIRRIGIKNPTLERALNEQAKFTSGVVHGFYDVLNDTAETGKMVKEIEDQLRSGTSIQTIAGLMLTEIATDPVGAVIGRETINRLRSGNTAQVSRATTKILSELVLMGVPGVGLVGKGSRIGKNFLKKIVRKIKILRGNSAVRRSFRNVFKNLNKKELSVKDIDAVLKNPTALKRLKLNEKVEVDTILKDAKTGKTIGKTRDVFAGTKKGKKGSGRTKTTRASQYKATGSDVDIKVFKSINKKGQGKIVRQIFPKKNLTNNQINVISKFVENKIPTGKGKIKKKVGDKLINREINNYFRQLTGQDRVDFARLTKKSEIDEFLGVVSGTRKVEKRVRLQKGARRRRRTDVIELDYDVEGKPVRELKETLKKKRFSRSIKEKSVTRKKGENPKTEKALHKPATRRKLIRDLIADVTEPFERIIKNNSRMIKSLKKKLLKTKDKGEKNGIRKRISELEKQNDAVKNEIKKFKRDLNVKRKKILRSGEFETIKQTIKRDGNKIKIKKILEKPVTLRETKETFGDVKRTIISETPTGRFKANPVYKRIEREGHVIKARRDGGRITTKGRTKKTTKGKEKITGLRKKALKRQEKRFKREERIEGQRRENVIPEKKGARPSVLKRFDQPGSSSRRTPIGKRKRIQQRTKRRGIRRKSEQLTKKKPTRKSLPSTTKARPSTLRQLEKGGRGRTIIGRRTARRKQLQKRATERRRRQEMVRGHRKTTRLPRKPNPTASKGLERATKQSQELVEIAKAEAEIKTKASKELSRLSQTNKSKRIKNLLKKRELNAKKTFNSVKKKFGGKKIVKNVKKGAVRTLKSGKTILPIAVILGGKVTGAVANKFNRELNSMSRSFLVQADKQIDVVIPTFRLQFDQGQRFRDRTDEDNSSRTITIKRGDDDGNGGGRIRRRNGNGGGGRRRTFDLPDPTKRKKRLIEKKKVVKGYYVYVGGKRLLKKNLSQSDAVDYLSRRLKNVKNAKVGQVRHAGYFRKNDEIDVRIKKHYSKNRKLFRVSRKNNAIILSKISKSQTKKGVKNVGRNKGKRKRKRQS